MHVVNTKQDLSNVNFQGLFEYWGNLLAGSDVPTTQQLTPDFLGNVAGFSKVIRRESDGRFRYIMVGEEFKKAYEDLEDKYLDEVYAPWIRKNVRNSYELCVAKGKPVYNKKGFATIIGNIGYEYILFPFRSESTGGVNYLASCVLPFGAKVEDFDKWNNLIEKTPWL